LLNEDEVYIVVLIFFFTKQYVGNGGCLSGNLLPSHFDYPTYHELGLSILHYLVFKDKSSPKDLLEAFKASFSSYEQYKSF